MATFNPPRPVLLGRLAVYAADRETARQVYALIQSQPQTRGFGTVTLDNGKEIDWVDMACGVVPPCEEHRQAK